MARAITGEELVNAVKQQTFIREGDIKSAEGIKYDFRMGSRVLKAKYGRSGNVLLESCSSPKLLANDSELGIVSL
jgi:hypothetical protein